MEFTLKLPIPFEFLTAAVEECLTRYSSYGWLGFTPERTGHTDMLYVLWQHQLRHLGEIKLRKVSEAESEMIVVGPSRPPERAPTPEEQAALAAISSALEREAAKIELARKIGAESDELYRRRRRHQERVVRAMVSELARNTEWKKAKRRLEELAGRPLDDIGARPIGRPRLSEPVLIPRLAKAKDAEEIRCKDPSMTWKEIAKEIGWEHGISDGGLALLRDARQRLQKLEKDDPEGLLKKVTRYRKAQETKETRKT